MSVNPNQESPEAQSKVIGEIVKWMGGKWTASANIVKAILPLAASAVPALSRQYLQYRASSDALEIAKKAMCAEHELINTARADVLKRIADTTNPADLVALKQRLEFLDEQTRAVPIHLRALERIESSKPQLRNSESSEVSDHWTDQFQRFARQRNEPWRAELLARALASEALKPGVVSTRLLWVIGTLEEEVFRCFEAFLDSCVWVGIFPLIPHDLGMEKGPIRVENSRIRPSLGSLIFDLGETGLISHTALWNNHDDEWKGDLFLGRRKITIEPIPKFAVQGAMLTSLGRGLAMFCDPKPNEFAENALSLIKQQLTAIGGHLTEHKLD